MLPENISGFTSAMSCKSLDSAENFKDYLRLSILNPKGDIPDTLRKERLK
jgi:hypothetical protein